MEEKKNTPVDGTMLSDETLTNVAGGYNPFSPAGKCKHCERALGDTYHVVTENGMKFNLCDNCYPDYLAGKFHFWVSLT